MGCMSYRNLLNDKNHKICDMLTCLMIYEYAIIYLQSIFAVVIRSKNTAINQCNPTDVRRGHQQENAIGAHPHGAKNGTQTDGGQLSKGREGRIWPTEPSTPR